MRTLLCFLPLFHTAVFAQSTIDSTGSSFAYGANIGWLNLRPSSSDGIVAAGSVLSGHAYAGNVGWIHFGDGTPANGYAYSNSSASDFGVNHDGAGNLGGYAYGANIGWINFGWTNSSDPQRPRIDLLTGDFSGYAYAANTGWIHLGSGYLRTATLVFPDSDGDGIADAWEMQWFGNLTAADAGSDHDQDGISDAAEFIAGTRPADPNSFFKITAHSYDTSFTQATLTFGFTTATRLYRIEQSDDLNSPWRNFGPVAFAPDAGDFTTRTFAIPGVPRRFFRAVALLPLQP